MKLFQTVALILAGSIPTAHAAPSPPIIQPRFTIENAAPAFITLSQNVWAALDAPSKYECVHQPCIIIVDADVQTLSNIGSSYVTICTFVDGNPMPGCLGTGNINDGYTEVLSHRTIHLSQGKHHFQTKILCVNDSIEVRYYQIDYNFFAQ